MPTFQEFVTLQAAAEAATAQPDKIFHCPHCDEEIEYLHYCCGTSGYESGSVSLNGQTGNIEDYESDDYGTNEKYDYEYSCPHCQEEIRPDIIREQAKTASTKKKPRPSQLNEDGKPVAMTDLAKELNKTFAPRHNYPSVNMEEFTKCPKCGALNDISPTENESECVFCNATIVHDSEEV